MDIIGRGPERRSGKVNRYERMLSIAGLVVLGIVLAFAFRAYLAPAMLLDFINVTFCS